MSLLLLLDNDWVMPVAPSVREVLRENAVMNRTFGVDAAIAVAVSGTQSINVTLSIDSELFREQS